MYVLLALLPVATASSIYPDTLASELAMPCAPTCLVCHETISGGSGTVTQPFGMAMQDRGLEGGSATDLVVSALAAMEADGVDSDSDGVIDVDELAVGDDPNGGAAFCSGDLLVPAYGCLTTVPVGPGQGRWAWIGGLAAGLVWTRRRRA